MHLYREVSPDGSDCHSTAIMYQELVRKCKDIVDGLDASARATMKENRKCFHKIIESLLYLGRQGIALQGHVEFESNFYQLLDIRATDVPELRKWLSQPDRADVYYTHDIQNEILMLLTNSIVRDAVMDIKTDMCTWYALIADEYTDISNKEQLSICFRWVNNDLEAKEDFIGFYEIPNIKSSTIDTVTKDALIRLQLSLSLSQRMPWTVL